MINQTPLHAVILSMAPGTPGAQPLHSGLVEAIGDTTAGGLPLYGSPNGDVLIAVAPALFAGQFTGTVLRMGDRADPENTTAVTLAEPFPAETHTP